MNEQASAVLNHLPIYPADMSSYIEHLWETFSLLQSADHTIRAFSIIPFHILFMLALQYKIYFYSVYDSVGYGHAVKKEHLHNQNDFKTVMGNIPFKDPKGIISPSSNVRNLSLIKETKICTLLQTLIGAESTAVLKAKALVKNRNNYAHANGNIETNIDEKISDYIDVLEQVHLKYSVVNQKLACSFFDGISQDDDIQEYLEKRYIADQVSTIDLGNMIRTLLGSKQLSLTQWSGLAEEGFKYCEADTLVGLAHHAVFNQRVTVRFNSVRLLKKMSALSDELLSKVVAHESSPALLAYLNV